MSPAYKRPGFVPIVSAEQLAELRRKITEASVRACFKGRTARNVERHMSRAEIYALVNGALTAYETRRGNP